MKFTPTRTACTNEGKFFPKFFPVMRDKTDPKSRFKFIPNCYTLALRVTFEGTKVRRYIIIPPICSAAVKPFEFAALQLERASRRWKICVTLAVRLWRKGCFFRIFLRWRLFERDPHSKQQSAMRKKSKGNSAVPKPLLPSAMARTPPDTYL